MNSVHTPSSSSSPSLPLPISTLSSASPSPSPASSPPPPPPLFSFSYHHFTPTFTSTSPPSLSLSPDSFPKCVLHSIFLLYSAVWNSGEWLSAAPKTQSEVNTTIFKSSIFLSIVVAHVKSDPQGQNENDEKHISPTPSHGNDSSPLSLSLPPFPKCFPHCSFCVPSPPLLIGFCFLSGDPHDPLLEDIITHHQFRKMGVAKTLISHFISTQKSSPLSIFQPKRIDLYCEEKLISFYSQFGFCLIRKSESKMKRKKIIVNQTENENKIHFYHFPHHNDGANDTEIVDINRCLMRKMFDWNNENENQK